MLGRHRLRAWHDVFCRAPEIESEDDGPYVSDDIDFVAPRALVAGKISHLLDSPSAPWLDDDTRYKLGLIVRSADKWKSSAPLDKGDL